MATSVSSLTDKGAKNTTLNTGGIAIVRDNARLREHEHIKTGKELIDQVLVNI